MPFSNPTIDGSKTTIAALLDALPRQATAINVTGTIAIPSWDGIENHYQGIAPVNGTSLMTTGWISASSSEGYFSGYGPAGTTAPVVRSVVYPDRRYYHVAGIQLMGTLLPVPCESDDRSLPGLVKFYDATVNFDPTYLYTLQMPGRKASAVAITSYRDSQDHYQALLMVYEYDHHEMYLYTAPFGSVMDRNSPWTFVKTNTGAQLNTGDQFQSFALVTQDIGGRLQPVYLLGFREDEECWLYELDMESGTPFGDLGRIATYTGWSGSDWRNGMGLQIIDSQTIRLFGTAKDPTGTSSNYSFNIYAYGT